VKWFVYLCKNTIATATAAANTGNYSLITIINIKNCNLSIMLTAMDQKRQKS